jgi:hypothetical protein
VESIQRFAKRDEPSLSSSRKLARDSKDAAIAAGGIQSENSLVENSNKQRQKRELSINPTGIFPILQNILLSSSKPLLRTAIFTAQLAIAAYLTKVSWNVVKEAWDEINEEYGNRKEEGVREEQDMPFVDSKAVTDLGDGNELAPGNGRNTPQITAMRDLATRLRSAGILYSSEVETDSYRSVEKVVKSLTRSEANVLSQTLLTPMDDGTRFDQNNQDSEAAAANAWNAIGGLSQAKESLLDLAFPLLPSSTESKSYYGGLLANPPGVLLYGPPGCGTLNDNNYFFFYMFTLTKTYLTRT